jgi:hypothetical protein
MTILDGPMGKLAQTLIGTFGAPATISRKGEPGYDTATGQSTADETESITCSVAWEEYHAREIDGTLVKTGDRKALVSRLELGYEPEAMRDALTSGGKAYRIVRVLGYPSGAEEAAYTLQVRQIALEDA